MVNLLMLLNVNVGKISSNAVPVRKGGKENDYDDDPSAPNSEESESSAKEVPPTLTFHVHTRTQRTRVIGALISCLFSVSALGGITNHPQDGQRPLQAMAGALQDQGQRLGAGDQRREEAKHREEGVMSESSQPFAATTPPPCRDATCWEGGALAIHRLVM
jgi:hypothetical protein